MPQPRPFDPGPRDQPAPRRGRRALLLVIAVTVIGWYLVPWLRHVPPDAPTAAIAHRGAPATSGAAEGTLAAFEASVDAGADWLEFDVRATRDGVLVVLHDDTVDRTTDGTGSVSDLTLEQVRALDAGGGARIPTVQEVVSLAMRTGGIPILPEIKDGPRHPSVAPDLVDLLRVNGYLDHAVIQAFEPETLVRLRDLAPDAGTCWLTGLWQFDITSPPAGAGYVCPMGEMVLLNPDMVRQAHAAGLAVFAWWDVSENAVTDRILEAYGVDGLIVDDVRPIVGR